MKTPKQLRDDWGLYSHLGSLKAIAAVQQDARKDLKQEIEKLKQVNAELAASEARLREALQWFVEKASTEGSIDSKPYCRWCYLKSGHTIDCLIGQALSTPPSDALTEYMKPLREALNNIVQELRHYANESADFMEGEGMPQFKMYEDQMCWAIRVLEKYGIKYDPCTGNETLTDQARELLKVKPV